MTFQIHTDGCTLSAAEQELLQTKLAKLTHLGHRLDDESVKTHVKIHLDHRHQTPSFELHAHVALPGQTLDASAVAADFAAAVDQLESKLRSQIEKLA